MTLLLPVVLTLTAVVGTAVTLTHDRTRQAVALSAYGLVLVLLFVLLQAPDVALSQLAVGAAVVPLMVMLTARSLARRRPDPDAPQDDEQPGRAAGTDGQAGG